LAQLKDAGLLTGAMALVSIDYKATGGYVLAPPSVVHGQPYVVLDHRSNGGQLNWTTVRGLLDPPRPHPPSASGGGDITHLAAWVERQPEGNRNCGLYWASRTALDAGAAPDQLSPLMAAAMTSGLSEAETNRTITSAVRAAGSTR
jgi:hypothetical protein